MSTHSKIIMKEKNGIYRSIYCHFDGYPTGVGSVLIKHYNTEDKVRELINLGALSSIGSEIGKKIDYDKMARSGTPAPDQFIAYHRDRGEELEIMKYSNIHDIMKSFCVEYYYVFDENNWYVFKSSPENAVLVKDIMEGVAKI